MTRTLHLQPIVPEPPRAGAAFASGSPYQWCIEAPDKYLWVQAPYGPVDILPDGSRCVSCEPKRLEEMTAEDWECVPWGPCSTVSIWWKRNFPDHPYSPDRWAWFIWSESANGDAI